MDDKNKSGFNPWPYAIIGFFVVFIGVTVGLVTMSVRNKAELVSADYYEQEIRYQRRLDSTVRAEAQHSQVRVSYETNLHRVTLTLPEGHGVLSPTGTVTFYRPSSSVLDHALPLSVDTHGIQVLDTAALRPGLWKLRVQWKVGEQEFYHDEGVVVGKTGPRA